MSNINKAAVLNPFADLFTNILDYVPRATTSTFGIVAIGSGINVDSLGRIYLDTQEYSDRLTAIEAQAASSLSTQQTAVAAAIEQVNLAQSQTITALTLEVNNLKTSLTNSITATETNLINRADQLAQDVSDITDQLALDKAAFTQEIQDALVYLEQAESVASALRTPRKIQGVDFDGTQDINLPVFTSEIDGLVPKRVGATSTKYLREDGTWVVPTNTAYPLLTQANAEAGTATTANTISAQVLKDAIKFHAPPVTDITGNAGTATKLQTSRNINGVAFDGSADITLPLASTAVSGTVQLNNTLTSTDTGQALTAAQGKALNDSKLGKTENAVSASKLQTSRTISLTGGVTGSVSFDGSANASIAATVTGLGVANGIATLDSSGQVPSTQLPSYVDDVLEYLNVAAFPTTGVTGKIYVETTGNTTYRWSGSAYVKITSGEVSSVAGKTGVVTLTKADVGLPNVDNTADSAKNVASAAKLTTARTIGGVSFDGSANINLPGVNTAGNQSTSGNAATATTLQTARTINGTSFNGSANITTTNWGTARTFTLGSTGKFVNGSADVSWSVDEILPTGTNGQVLKHNGTSWVAGADSNTTYSEMTEAEAITGTASTSRVITPAVLKSAITAHAPVQTTISGNAATATKLATARTISLTGAVTGSVSFDGTSDASVSTTIADTVAITQGGTGATTVAAARTNLDVYSKDEVNEAITTSVSIVADATTIDKGVVRLATESDITTSSETAVVTPKNVADMLVGLGSLAKGFRALFSARLTQMTGTNISKDKTITCTITAHGLSVGDVVRVAYGYKLFSTDKRATDTVVVTSVANADTFTFISPQSTSGSASAGACTLYYVIKNNYNVNSLAINSVGRYTISINTASGINGTSFIPFIQATTTDNSLVLVQPEAITSATSLTVLTFDASGAAITPQWLHIGVMQ